MELSLGPHAEKLIRAKMKSGEFATPEDVVLAALRLLMQKPDDEFAPGELRALLDVADEQIDRGEVLDGEKVLRELRELRAQSRSKAG